MVAAALWYPYKALPQDRVDGLGGGVVRRLRGPGERATRTRASGCCPAPRCSTRRTEDPWWAGAVPDLEHVGPPAGYADAWSFTAPVIDMPVYLRWLRARLDELGGTLTRMSLGALPSRRPTTSW